MVRAKIARPCKTCGNEFLGWTGNANLYCSNDCYHSNRDEAIKRFWSKVEKTATCWIWKGKLTTKGYGKSGLGAAHRVAWELLRGPIPTAQFVCHKCDNPPCCNPEHLFLGTAADNNRDMVRKGRSPWGERHPNALVNASSVIEIRRLYGIGHITMKSLASQFGLSPSAVAAIVNRKTWTHL